MLQTIGEEVRRYSDSRSAVVICGGRVLSYPGIMVSQPAHCATSPSKGNAEG